MSTLTRRTTTTAALCTLTVGLFSATSATSATAGTATVGSAALADPQRVRVVTVNVDFGAPASTVRDDFARYSRFADIVMLQEARDVRLADLVDTSTWIVRQDTSSESTRGSALAIRRTAVRATGQGMFQFLKNQYASGFAHYKTIAVLVVWPRSRFRIIVSFTQCLHGIKSAYSGFAYHAFGPACNYHICLAHA